MEITLGMVEYKDIIDAINKAYNIDFSNYALTSLKRRFEIVIKKYSFSDYEEFIKKIVTDKKFLEILLYEISIPYTEMFRDPELWLVIKKSIIPIIRKKEKYRIWLPECTTGDELYTLLIVLKESDLLNKVEVIVNNLSIKNINRIKQAYINLKKMEINAANYQRFDGNYRFSEYYYLFDKQVQLKEYLFDNVIFKQNHIIDDELNDLSVDIVLFRNRLLSLNPQLQKYVVDMFHRKLKSGGFLIIGVKEHIDLNTHYKKFTVFNKSEKVYKKTY